MNGLHFFFGIGSFLAPVIIAQVMLRNGGIDWAYWSLALLIVPVAFWLLRLPAPQTQAPPESGDSANQRSWLVGLLVVFFFLHVGAMVAFSGWVYTYTVTLFPGSQLTATYLTSAFWGALTITRLISIPVAARVKTGILLLLALVGSLISLAVILTRSGSLTALWVGTCGMGASLATLYPLGVCLAQERITLTGRIGGWMFAGASAGGMVIPWLVGRLFEIGGPQVTMWVSAGCLSLALLVMLAINNPKAATASTQAEPA
jgi:FHS family Na+ dependent glucose MFS transporter 1